MEKRAIDLLTHKRFDVMPKYMYAYFREKGIPSDFGERIYKEHLRVWNGFKEYNNPQKNTFDKFKETFDALLDDIKVNGFNPEKPIPVHVKVGDVLNGAHRLSSCILYDKPIHVRPTDNKQEGQVYCDHDMFKGMGLKESYMDAMAIQYIEMKPNTYIVTLFPAGRGRRKEAMDLIKTEGNIVYHKTTKIGFEGSVNLMRLFYGHESWAGNWDNNFQGCRGKSEVCYKDGNYVDIDGDTTFVLVEFPTIEHSIRCKQKVRNMYQVSNHSIHINDTYDETLKVGRTVFNDNGIHFLNNTKRTHFKRYETLLSEYKKLIPKGEENNYCVTASGVLTAYGLRECNDIDYIHSGPKLTTNNHLISSHNDYSIDTYPLPKDNIIFDNENYFWYDGVKFTSLDIVHKLKSKRGEDKDFVDINLINSL